MKINKYIAILMFAIFASCNTENINTDEHEHEHGEEGVVKLNKEQQKALDLKIGSFEMRNLTTIVKINGQLEVAPQDKADITTLIGGTVREIKVFYGDKVKKGQVLAILEHPDFISLQEEFAEVANDLEYLEQNYKRQKHLIETKATSDQDFQKSKSEYFTKKARYQGLKSRLLLLNLSPEKVKQGEITNLISLISPISGYVNSLNIKLGSFVSTKDILLEVVDNNAIHADFMVYEKDVHFLKIGQKIHFTVSNKNQTEYTATIFAIGKQFEKDTRAVHIHSEIDDKIDGLIPGMYITGHLHTDKNYVKTLPNDAIVTEGDKSYIFIVDNDEHDEHEGNNHEAEDEQSHEGHNHDISEENHEGHNHESDEHAEHKEEHNHEADEHDHEGSEHVEEKEILRLKMVEVIVGSSDDAYTEVRLLEELPTNTKVAINSAYYLLSDLKKEETEHEH